MAGAVVADFLTGDWGVWRTVQQSILIVGERLVELDINDDGRACGRERRLHGVPRMRLFDPESENAIAKGGIARGWPRWRRKSRTRNGGES
jgi:hypothetical protein